MLSTENDRTHSSQYRRVVPPLRPIRRVFATWTEAEDDAVRRLYPNYAAIQTELRSRSYDAIRCRALTLGIVRKRHIWTASEVSKLRKVYGTGTVDDIRRAFPHLELAAIAMNARRFGARRPDAKLVQFGNPLVDSVRARARSLGYSLSDLDKELTGSRIWTCGRPGVSLKHIEKAVRFLDGKLTAIWQS